MSGHAGLLHVQGAGPKLAYEIVRPPGASASNAPLTLLCLHGNSSHRGIWRPVAYGLADAGFPGLLLDLRGHGDSDHVVPPAYDPPDHAADIVQVVIELGLTRYAILGHSNGALVAARFITAAGRFPTVPPPVAFIWVDLDPLVPRGQVAYFRERADSVGRVFPTVEDVLVGFQRMYPNVSADVLRTFIAEGLRPVESGWRMKLDPATFATWEPGDLRPELTRITCPTLVLRGAASLVSSPEGLADLQRRLPRCEVREIPGGSHLLLLEYPERVAKAIREFLRGKAVGQVMPS